jgi:sulfatase maturation enzyme AslB (radical SAM superfamily)
MAQDAREGRVSDPYLNQPREISIETLALCNAACEFCPYPTLERRGTRLDDTTLLHLIEQMRQWKQPFFVSPFKVNEPFLDKRLLSFCGWINSDLPLARLRIFTNGSRFTADNVQELLALKNIEHIWVSLNEVDPIRYKETMKYVAFEHVADKLDILHKAWLRAIKHRVRVSRVSEIDPRVESERRQEFDRYVAKRWPGFVTFHIKRDGWIDFTTPANSSIPQGPCARWWELSITANGVAALCCMDGHGAYALGNIYDSSLDTLYNLPTMVRRRLAMINRDKIEPCNRCTY